VSDDGEECGAIEGTDRTVPLVGADV